MSEAQSIAPFSSDGCSLFIDGNQHNRHQWSHCCIEHDLAYWQGGSHQQKRQADQQLKNCVAQTGNLGIAEIMHLGVNLGGSPYFPTWYRWGYGWPYNRGFKVLSPQDMQQVKLRLQQLQQMLTKQLHNLNLSLETQHNEPAN